MLLTAWKIGRDPLADYSHRHSPRTFTQPQLFACLALKTFYKTDDRGVAALLHDTPGLCQTIRLKIMGLRNLACPPDLGPELGSLNWIEERQVRHGKAEAFYGGADHPQAA